MEKTVAALVGMNIGRWLLLKMLYIVISLIMNNLFLYMQKIEPLGKMLKQLHILLKK
ncbi:hypothetical protein Golax_025993 [Gossypium laxum]|uniref:Uncharacterized protein n=1 Tax=Gossypium laxum TaxID=34288 RepID=A0A7J9B066_9ROSI|nr:hypothetical protein [Gossypium laxum]